MKCICNLKDLSEAVNNVSIAVSQRSTIPALEGILIKAKNNQLTLTGYDLEIGIKKEIDVQIEEEGAVILNSHLFLDIIRKVNSEKMEIMTDEKMLSNIRCDEASFTILGMDPDEFPEIPTFEKEKSLEIEAFLLKKMIGQTIFAVSQSEQNPVLTGALFEIKEGNLNIVAVDGFRLALRKEKINTQEDFSFVVPGETLRNLLKMLKEDEESLVKISVGKKHIIFEMDGYLVISRLLEGNFIDYQAVIPEKSLTQIKINKREFMQSIERASIIINDRAKNPIQCEIQEGIIKVFSESTMGKVNDKLNAEIQGENVRIGFNNQYMMDALKRNEDEEFLMEINGPLSPIKLLPLKTEDDHYLFIVVPVRLKN